MALTNHQGRDDVSLELKVRHRKKNWVLLLRYLKIYGPAEAFHPARIIVLLNLILRDPLQYRLFHLFLGILHLHQFIILLEILSNS
jgi:hypothetical protein